MSVDVTKFQFMNQSISMVCQHCQPWSDGWVVAMHACFRERACIQLCNVLHVHVQCASVYSFHARAWPCLDYTARAKFYPRYITACMLYGRACRQIVHACAYINLVLISIYEPIHAYWLSTLNPGLMDGL